MTRTRAHFKIATWLMLWLSLSSCNLNDRRDKSPTAIGSETDGPPPQASAPHRTLDPDDPLWGLDVADCGEYHNEILRSFDRRHSFASRKPIDYATYNKLMVDACNEVLSTHGIAGRVTLDDINFLARQGHHVAVASGFEFTNFTKDDPFRLIEFLRRTGRITASEEAELFRIASHIEAGSIDASSPPALSTANPVVQTYLDVANASLIVWKELTPREPSGSRHPIAQSEIFDWVAEQLIDAAYAAVFGGGLLGAIIGAYFSGVVALILSQLNPPTPVDLPGGYGSGDYGDGCPCCLCTGP